MALTTLEIVETPLLTPFTMSPKPMPFSCDALVVFASVVVGEKLVSEEVKPTLSLLPEPATTFAAEESKFVELCTVVFSASEKLLAERSAPGLNAVLTVDMVNSSFICSVNHSPGHNLYCIQRAMRISVEFVDVLRTDALKSVKSKLRLLTVFSGVYRELTLSREKKHRQ
jgi:hypothetical protein